MRRRHGRIALAAGIVAAAALAAALVAVLGGRGAPLSPPHGGIGVRTVLEPRSALFGDELSARVDVVLDRRAVDVGSLKLAGLYGPYVPAGPVRTARRDVGSLSRLELSVALECLQLACLPPDPLHGGTRFFRLATLRLVYTRRGGAAGSLPVTWPPLEVASRVTPGDLARLNPIDQPPFHVDMTPPPVNYSIAPGLLVALLAAGGALLLAGAGLLALRVVRLGRGPVEPEPEPAPEPRAPAREPTPLELALLLLDRARERGDVPEQRKALEHLAGELRRCGERRLAGSATALAWAEEPPAAAATGALQTAVERRVREEANGNGHAG